MSFAARVSSGLTGTQIRPSLRSDSDIRVSFDWNSSCTGIQVGWIWVKHGLAKWAPLRCALHMAVVLHAMALVERKNTLL